MSCALCQAESQTEGFASAGAFGTQVLCSCSGAVSPEGPASTPPLSFLKREEMDVLQTELRSAQVSIAKLESTDLPIINGTVAGATATELSDAELVEVLDKVLGHVDLTQVHSDPADCISETEPDTEGALAMINKEFLPLPSYWVLHTLATVPYQIGCRIHTVGPGIKTVAKPWKDVFHSKIQCRGFGASGSTSNPGPGV
ncbi:hypothetical protein VKT23_020497 [Stygiomarasmius scandens]|uniref:Uncharacterized protein n=1 Tax=Marasmiellus scandens TaxID=2682957 RepID=A0ABR1ILN3_9AGAR